ncbi:hypothetical protein [Micromonospora sp. NBC_00617]|uniref:hypothetical protein n=1 Tax=Micromonospora sp. NBC_00617 TaxID=2903587 RepID=UPI0030E4B29B
MGDDVANLMPSLDFDHVVANLPDARQPGLPGLMLDEVLAAMESVVDSKSDVEAAPVLVVWAESLRELRAWLLRPAVKGVTISLAYFLLTTWWMQVKTEHPDMAGVIEPQLWTAVGILATLAIGAKKK